MGEEGEKGGGWGWGRGSRRGTRGGAGRSGRSVAPTAASPGKLLVNETSSELREVPGPQFIGCNQPPSPPLLHILLCVPPPLCPSLISVFLPLFFFFSFNICSSVLIHGLLSLCSAACWALPSALFTFCLFTYLFSHTAWLTESHFPNHELNSRPRQ